MLSKRRPQEVSLAVWQGPLFLACHSPFHSVRFQGITAPGRMKMEKRRAHGSTSFAEDLLLLDTIKNSVDSKSLGGSRVSQLSCFGPSCPEMMAANGSKLGMTRSMQPSQTLLLLRTRRQNPEDRGRNPTQETCSPHNASRLRGVKSSACQSMNQFRWPPKHQDQQTLRSVFRELLNKSWAPKPWQPWGLKLA